MIIVYYIYGYIYENDMNNENENIIIDKYKEIIMELSNTNYNLRKKIEYFENKYKKHHSTLKSHSYIYINYNSSNIK